MVKETKFCTVRVCSYNNLQPCLTQRKCDQHNWPKCPYNNEEWFFIGSQKLLSPECERHHILSHSGRCQKSCPVFDGNVIVLVCNVNNTSKHCLIKYNLHCACKLTLMVCLSLTFLQITFVSMVGIEKFFLPTLNYSYKACLKPVGHISLFLVFQEICNRFWSFCM